MDSGLKPSLEDKKDEWRHYSAKPIVKLQNIDPRESSFKPKGLYCSKGTRWIDHCEEMGCSPAKYTVYHKVTVPEEIKIYEMKSFSKDFRH